MNSILNKLVFVGILLASIPQSYSQGFIVPNGIITNYYDALPHEISVVHDPVNYAYTGFSLMPVGITPPTAYTNTFMFNAVVDVSVRVFLVVPRDPISLQPIMAGDYTELQLGQNLVFDAGKTLYLGLYTGNVNNAPPDGIYSDPLFGWVKLGNKQGNIVMLDGAIEYGGGGILAGTRTILPVPEPSVLALGVLGTVLLCLLRRRDASR